MLKSSCVAPVCSVRPTENPPRANRHTRPLWSEFIFALDSWLRRREGVFEYSQKTDCIFRAQFSRLSSDVLLSDGTIGRSGDRVIDLHLWNEQIPVAPLAGYSLAWGCRFSRSFFRETLFVPEMLRRWRRARRERKAWLHQRRERSFNFVRPCGCAASTRRRRFRASAARFPPSRHRLRRYR